MILPTKAYLIQREHQFKTDPIIRSYHYQMARIYELSLIDHAIISPDSFQVYYDDNTESRLSKLNKELNQYIEANYSDVLNWKP